MHPPSRNSSGVPISCSSSCTRLLNGNMRTLPYLTTQAKRTAWIVRENLWWAAGYNLIMVPLAAAGCVTPWVAALGMSLSSLLVSANALRLLRRAK